MDAPSDEAGDAGVDAPGAKRGLWQYYGPRIKEAREQRGIKIGELAKQVGLSHKTLRNIEHGEYGTGIQNLIAIAEALDYPVTHFLPIKKGPVYEQLWLTLSYLSERQAKLFLKFLRSMFPDVFEDEAPC